MGFLLDLLLNEIRSFSFTMFWMWNRGGAFAIFFGRQIACLGFLLDLLLNEIRSFNFTMFRGDSFCDFFQEGGVSRFFSGQPPAPLHATTMFPVPSFCTMRTLRSKLLLGKYKKDAYLCEIPTANAEEAPKS